MSDKIEDVSVHDYRGIGPLVYDMISCADEIQDGDVIDTDYGFLILVGAYPCHLETDIEFPSFHTTSDWKKVDDGRYMESVKVAEKEKKARAARIRRSLVQPGSGEAK